MPRWRIDKTIHLMCLYYIPVIAITKRRSAEPMIFVDTCFKFMPTLATATSISDLMTLRILVLVTLIFLLFSVCGAMLITGRRAGVLLNLAGLFCSLIPCLFASGT